MVDHTLHHIAPHTYWLSPDSTTDRPVLGVVVGTRDTLLIDAGNSPAHVWDLRAALAQHGLPPPTFLALTHWHWDHVFGTATLVLPTFAFRETKRIVNVLAGLDWSDAALDRRVAEGSEIAFCRDMIKAELPDRSDLVIAPPTIGFDTEVELDLGGVACQIIHVGGDHSPDSSIVYVPQDKIIFLGDCIYDDLYHGPRRLVDTTIISLMEYLLAHDADWYLGSHHTEPISRTQLIDEATLLANIGVVVAAQNQDRAAILAALPEALHAPIDEDHIGIVDAFLAGAHMPFVDSVY